MNIFPRKNTLDIVAPLTKVIDQLIKHQEDQLVIADNAQVERDAAEKRRQEAVAESITASNMADRLYKMLGL